MGMPRLIVMCRMVRASFRDCIVSASGRYANVSNACNAEDVVGAVSGKLDGEAEAQSAAGAVTARRRVKTISLKTNGAARRGKMGRETLLDPGLQEQPPTPVTESAHVTEAT